MRGVNQSLMTVRYSIGHQVNQLRAHFDIGGSLFCMSVFFVDEKKMYIYQYEHEGIQKLRIGK